MRKNLYNGDQDTKKKNTKEKKCKRKERNKKKPKVLRRAGCSTLSDTNAFGGSVVLLKLYLMSAYWDPGGA